MKFPIIIRECNREALGKCLPAKYPMCISALFIIKQYSLLQSELKPNVYQVELYPHLCKEKPPYCFKETMLSLVQADLTKIL
jgi:hypothetical protein